MQFVRCVLHQLSGNGIFSMIFHMDLQGSHRQKFFNTIVQCLLDFTELSPAVPVGTFFQEMNERKNISSEFLELSLPNLACYLSCIPFEQVNSNYYLVPISTFTIRPLTYRFENGVWCFQHASYFSDVCGLYLAAVIPKELLLPIPKIQSTRLE